jgi:Carbohydrate binding domain
MITKTATGLGVLAVLMCLAGCGARSEGEVGGKTSWLSRCTRDSDCGTRAEARCVQHLCTARCDPNDCSAISGTACAPADVSACVSEPSCLPSCTRQEDCQRFGNDYACVDSLCVQSCVIPEVNADNDASVSPAFIDGSGPSSATSEPPLVSQASGETDANSGTSGPAQENAAESTGGGSVPTTQTDVSTSLSAEPDLGSVDVTSPASELPTNDATSNEATSSDVTSGDSYEPPLVVDGNLLQNPDFETEVEPWYVMGDAQIARTTAEAHTGYASLSCVGRTQAWEGPAVSVLSLMTPGALYVMRAWVKAEYPSGAVFHIVAFSPCITDAGGGASDSESYTQIAAAFSTADEWVQLETVPFSLKDCGPEELVLYIEGPTPGTSFYLDDVSLVEYLP